MLYFEFENELKFYNIWALIVGILPVEVFCIKMGDGDAICQML